MKDHSDPPLEQPPIGGQTVTSAWIVVLALFAGLVAVDYAVHILAGFALGLGLWLVLRRRPAAVKRPVVTTARHARAGPSAVRKALRQSH